MTKKNGNKVNKPQSVKTEAQVNIWANKVDVYIDSRKAVDSYMKGRRYDW